MKRVELLRMIARAARERNLPWEPVREGGNHEVWRLANHAIVVPRHREIGEKTARRILKSVEPALGKEWWRQ